MELLGSPPTLDEMDRVVVGVTVVRSVETGLRDQRVASSRLHRPVSV